MESGHVCGKFVVDFVSWRKQEAKIEQCFCSVGVLHLCCACDDDDVIACLSFDPS